jgi:endonuclease III
MQNLEKINKIYSILEKESSKFTIPLAEQIQIKTKNPFFVLIGTILSARTKDTTTAKICDKLFLKIKNFEDLEKISLKELEELIYGVGFYKTKAKHLKELPFTIKKFNNKIPKTIEELISLPGVGRKTANLVVSVAFDKPAICVDTHVHKIFNRIGIINTKTPLETEIQLRKILPINLWQKTNLYFVILGQNICFPINPKCNICPINTLCEKKINKKNINNI